MFSKVILPSLIILNLFKLDGFYSIEGKIKVSTGILRIIFLD